METWADEWNEARQRILRAREVIPLDKQILEQYIDACELIKDTKEEIRKLRKCRSIEQDSVKGSSHEFPYTLQTCHLEGLGYAAVKDLDELERMEVLLEERIRKTQRRLSVRWKHGLIQSRPECSGLSGTGCLRI